MPKSSDTRGRKDWALVIAGAVACIQACSDGGTDPGTQPQDADGAAEETGGDLCSAAAPAVWADWPMPNPALASLPRPASYRLQSDALAVDDVTGLIWQRQVDSATHAWEDAKALCEDLVLEGHCDFRLPSRIELVSLIDFTRLSPAIDVDAFPRAPLFPFWSSSRAQGSASGAWFVDFDRGDTKYVDTSAQYLARCVRGAADPVSRIERYVVDQSTVQDIATGLVWERVLFADSLSWSDALGYCDTLDLGGQEWRLPSMKELQTLVDETQARSPTIDASAFPNTPAASFWTSSPERVAERAWKVAFNFEGSEFTGGFSTPSDVEEELRVRCVR